MLTARVRRRGMKYKRFGEDIVARLEVGEEVIASLSDIAEREGVTFAPR